MLKVNKKARSTCLGTDYSSSVVVTGIAFDWLSGNIYWVDAGDNNRIEVARGDGSHRRAIIERTSNGHGLDRPRDITLAPTIGCETKIMHTVSFSRNYIESVMTCERK